MIPLGDRLGVGVWGASAGLPFLPETVFQQHIIACKLVTVNEIVKEKQNERELNSKKRPSL